CAVRRLARRNRSDSSRQWARAFRNVARCNSGRRVADRGGRVDAGRPRRPLSKQALSSPAHPSYLKDNCTQARYAVTLPFSTFRSVFTTSATRKSRSVRAAVSTAFRAASSQDFVLVPIISVTLYTALVG